MFVLPPAALAPFDSSNTNDNARASRPPQAVASVLGDCLRAPVDAPLGARFVEPTCPYCAGRRTLGFAAVAGDLVRSAVTGRIHFSGVVVGSGYVTVVSAVDTSLLVTVGGVNPGPPNRPDRFRLFHKTRAHPTLAEGASIEAGQVIGVAAGPIGLSMRRRSPSGPDTYLDPEPYLARRRVRARLVPLADPGPADPPRRVARTGFGCHRRLSGGADLGPVR